MKGKKRMLSCCKYHLEKIGPNLVHIQAENLQKVQWESRPWTKGERVHLLALLAFLPSVISSFLPKLRGRGVGPLGPSLDPPVKWTRYYRRAVIIQVLYKPLRSHFCLCNAKKLCYDRKHFSSKNQHCNKSMTVVMSIINCEVYSYFRKGCSCDPWCVMHGPCFIPRGALT